MKICLLHMIRNVLPYFTEYSPTAFEVENFTSLGGGIVIGFQSEHRKVHGKA